MEEQPKEFRKLYRSRSNRYIGGVCGGLGNYFSVDANLFRILFVVFTFTGGLGLIVYLAALIIVPENPSEETEQREPGNDKTMLWALLFIIVGLVLLFKQFGLFHYFHFWQIPWSTLWAFFFIGIGILLVVSANKKQKPSDEEKEQSSTIPEIDKIYRSRDDRMLAGVCAGIAHYFNMDPSIVRILWVVATFASIGLGVLAYIVLIFVLKETPKETDIPE